MIALAARSFIYNKRKKFARAGSVHVHARKCVFSADKMKIRNKNAKRQQEKTVLLIRVKQCWVANLLREQCIQAEAG